MRFRVFVLAAFLLGVLSLVGCSGPSGGSSGSRAQIYDSVTSLAADSTLVVVGIAGDQRVVEDIETDFPFTLTQFEIVRSANVSRLGENLSMTDRRGVSDAEVTVRQVGSDASNSPTALLESGRSYLLFLTPSQLPGELAQQYYVTGGNAGLYGTDLSASQIRQRGSTIATVTTFTQVDPEPGENLPAELSVTDLAQLP